MGNKANPLFQQAWKLQATYIKARDKSCVTCGATAGLVAGHFKHGTADFDERNINAQCNVCNTHRNGNPNAYRTYMLARWGAEAVREIEAGKHIPKKYSEDELLGIIEKYKRPLNKE